MEKGPNKSSENPTALKVQREAVTRSLKRKPELIVLQSHRPSSFPLTTTWCLFAEKGPLSLRLLCNTPTHTCHFITLICACFGFHLCSRLITSLTGILYLCLNSFYSPLENQHELSEISRLYNAVKMHRLFTASPCFQRLVYVFSCSCWKP